jgi:hypothetical protein
MPRTLSDTQSPFIPEDAGLDVRLDIARNSNHFGSFQKWWDCSTLRLLAEEIRNLPRRIQNALTRKHLRYGYSLPRYPTFDSRESKGQGYEFLCACSEDIQKLYLDNPWAGCLDLELAGAAYQAGAQWAFRLFRTEGASMVSESQSCNQISQVPNAGTDASGHSRGDSEAGMDADEIIVREV